MNPELLVRRINLTANRIVPESAARQPEVTITYFVPDKKKAGGAYVSVSGTVKKIDNYEQLWFCIAEQAFP